MHLLNGGGGTQTQTLKTKNLSNVQMNQKGEVVLLKTSICSDGALFSSPFQEYFVHFFFRFFYCLEQGEDALSPYEKHLYLTPLLD